MYDLMINDDARLPSGYRYGAHVSGPGWSGYYVIRESDDARCIAGQTPESTEPPTADDIDDAIAAAADEAAAEEAEDEEWERAREEEYASRRMRG